MCSKSGTETVTLYDPVRNQVFEFELSPEDAFRAKNDMHFATELLKSVVAGQQTEEIAEESIEAETNECGAAVYRWTSNAVRLLISIYKENEDKFSSGKWPQKKIWDEIAANLNQNGHNVTGIQCLAKLRSLKKTYKAVIDHNKKSGNNRRTWEFFEIMDEVFAKKAWVSPVAVASSTNCIEQENGSSSGPSTSKTTVASLMVKRLKQKQEIEESKAKRHKERMEMDEKILQVLMKLAEK